ncbi:hypothetical protein AMJ86_09535, partial [bacterium SM23_57]
MPSWNPEQRFRTIFQMDNHPGWNLIFQNPGRLGKFAGRILIFKNPGRPGKFTGGVLIFKNPGPHPLIGVVKIRHSVARMDQGVEKRDIGWVEILFENAKGVFQVTYRPGANDGCGYARLVFDPQKCQLGSCHAPFSSHIGYFDGDLDA